MAQESLQRTGSPSDATRIGEVAQELCLPVTTIRVWERRYGIPDSVRTAGGHRRYRPSDVQKLRWMLEEVGRGRPPRDAAALAHRRYRDRHSPEFRFVSQLFQDRRVDDPRRVAGALDEAAATLGLARAVATVVAWTIREIKDQSVEVPPGLIESLRLWLRSVDVREPSGRRVDLAWMRGEDCSVAMEALGGMVRARGCATMRVGPVTDPRVLGESISRDAPDAILLEASSTAERVAAVRAIREVARDGRAEVLYTGAAFLAPTSRRHVPGTYLDDDLALASRSLAIRFSGAPEGLPA